MDARPLPPPSAIQLSVANTGPNMAGSDGSVNPSGGDRACAYCICIQTGGLRHCRAMWYPSSTYSTSHRSELEGVYNTLLIRRNFAPPLPSPCMSTMMKPSMCQIPLSTPNGRQCLLKLISSWLFTSSAQSSLTMGATHTSNGPYHTRTMIVHPPAFPLPPNSTWIWT
jgi:hypothetical protein